MGTELNDVLPCLRKAVCLAFLTCYFWMRRTSFITFAFYIWLPPSVQPCNPLYKHNAQARSSSSPLISKDDGVVQTQGVKYPSWINASNSVCRTSIHTGSTSLYACRAAVRKGRLWLQQLLMSPFTA